MSDIFDAPSTGPAPPPMSERTPGPRPMVGGSKRFHRGGAPRFALGRLKPGQMNKSEAAYAQHLDTLKAEGAVLWYRFEGMKLRLADNTFYTGDFVVMVADGTIEIREVKGFWQDDARAKIKIASDQYPFRFVAVKARAKKHGGGWEEEEF